ncbi:hypothetical protein ACH5RR_025891 [Cinchona calisaya]|uniref:Uncharacterized protein n=1 Tax=Cinchona calisaya TaxID=153742 RepID=A0ABD2Z381_9GENT
MILIPGRPFSPAKLHAVIYRNIRSEYHAIITAMNLRTEPVSFHELHGQLIAHDILFKSSNDLLQANVAFRQSVSAPLLSSPNQINNTRCSNNWNGNVLKGRLLLVYPQARTAPKRQRTLVNQVQEEEKDAYMEEENLSDDGNDDMNQPIGEL